MSPASTVDPVQFEVIRNALVEVAEEMGMTLRRSAYSTNIKTRADFSCVIFDAEPRFLASNFAQATHLGRCIGWCRSWSATTGRKTSVPTTRSWRTTRISAGCT